MAIAYKVLGQAIGQQTEVDLYTVAAGKTAIVSTLAINNTSNASVTGSVYVRVSGATTSVLNCLYSGTLEAYQLVALTLGITLSTGDIITVLSNSSNAISFQAFGSEIS